MTQELPFKSGDEQDALSGWRRVLRFRPGERKKTKNVYARRVRRWARKMLRREVREES